ARYCTTAAQQNVAQEMKKILRTAVMGDLDSALSLHEKLREKNDVPDWGVVKLSSVLLANGREKQSELLLHRHYQEYGGEHRFARKSLVQEEQVAAALLRVMNCSKENALANARQLYQWLLRGHYCSNKDSFIILFVEKALESGGVKAAVLELEQLLRLGRVKSLTRTLHLLLFTAMKHRDTSEISQVDAIVTATAPASLDRLKGFVLLELGRRTEFVESLQGDRLEAGYLRFMVDLAAKLRAVVVLESLLDLSNLLQFRRQEKASVYDELVKIYGKLEKAEDLEKILDLVLQEKDNEHFRATLARLAHFYR
ncbi:hypothetical protein Y032_0182g875, partial [Ancylostoma ceylanicum]